MASRFSETSRRVCLEFLQTAVIIDDRAFQRPPVAKAEKANTPSRGRQKSLEEPKASVKHEYFLNTKDLVRGFAKNGILCSAIEFGDLESDLPVFKEAAKSTDIAIVDWELAEDKAGIYALKLISSLVQSDVENPERFRLIAIYTAKNDLIEISSAVLKHFRAEHGVDLCSGESGLLLTHESIVITIYAKDARSIPKHLHFNAVDEAGLPDELISCFSKSVSGIVPNAAIATLTALRKSTHRLLRKFDRSLDFGFLTHRACLPKPEDASSQLEALIAEELKSILRSHDCVEVNVSYAAIKDWVTASYKKQHEFHIDDNIKLTRGDVLLCLKQGSENAEISRPSFSKTKKKELYKHFSLMLSGDKAVADKSDVLLSNLSIIKTMYREVPPSLTMGVIIQSVKDDDYWLCIQPRCDSIRLFDEGKSTCFPLLPILKGRKKKSFNIPDLCGDGKDLFFHIPIHIQYCKCVEFRSSRKDLNEIYPKCDSQHYYYLTTTNGLRFKFVAELREEIIQSIMNNLAAVAARVGVNPSEWLRRIGES